MTALAKQIALPHEFAPERFPSFPALERTAVMGFNAPVAVNCRASNPEKFLITRQATYPCWGPASAANSASIYYQPAITSGVNVDNKVTSLPLDNVKDYTVTNVLASAGTVGISGIASPLTKPIMGVDQAYGSAPFLYCPNAASANTIAVITIGTTVAACNVAATVTVRQWTAPGESVLRDFDVAASGANLTTLVQITPAMFGAGDKDGVWMRLEHVTFASVVDASSKGQPIAVLTSTPCGVTSTSGSGTTAGSIVLASGAEPALLPLSYPVEFTNSKLPWYSTRTTAAAVLMTNVSQVLVKGGTILAGRVAPSVVSPWSVNSTYISGLHPAEKAYLPLETGFYSYCPPSTDLARFDDYTITERPGAATTLDIPVYRLDNDSLVNVVFVTAASTAEQLALNIDWHIEFRTSSTLFQLGLSAITLEAFHTAQLALVQAGFFFENPEHKGVLNKIAQSASRIGRAAFNAAAFVYPEVRAVKKGIQAARTILLPSHAYGTTMPTTSAEGSGMTSKKKKVAAKKKAKVSIKGKKK